MLDCIRNVGKEFGDIVADYQVGRTTGVLFLRSALSLFYPHPFLLGVSTLSLKYHRLHPEYIRIRIEKLGHSYTLRILLILCDIVCNLPLSPISHSYLTLLWGNRRNNETRFESSPRCTSSCSFDCKHLIAKIPALLNQ